MVNICYSSLGERSLDRRWYRFMGSRLRASSIPRSVYPSDSLSGLDSPSRTSLILMSSHFSSSPFTIVHTKHIEDTRHYRGWKGFYLTIEICDSHYNAGFLKFDLWFQTIVNTYHAPEVVHIFSWISCKYTICLQGLMFRSFFNAPESQIVSDTLNTNTILTYNYVYYSVGKEGERRVIIK